MTPVHRPGLPASNLKDMTPVHRPGPSNLKDMTPVHRPGPPASNIKQLTPFHRLCSPASFSRNRIVPSTSTNTKTQNLVNRRILKNYCHRCSRPQNR